MAAMAAPNVPMASAPVHPELCALITSNWTGCFPITGYGASEGVHQFMTRSDFEKKRWPPMSIRLPL